MKDEESGNGQGSLQPWLQWGKEEEGGLVRRGWLLLSALHVLSQVLQHKISDSYRGSERLSDLPSATQPAGFVFSNFEDFRNRGSNKYLLF